MEPVVIALAGGAVSGAVAGLFLSVLDSWGKNLRDAGLRARRLPLPSDRVPAAYHWPLAVLGALHGALLAGLGVPPLWAALSVFVIPALYAVFLVLAAPFALLARDPRRRDFDPGTLVGMDVAEATRVARENGWPCEPVEEPPGPPPPPRFGPRRDRGLAVIRLGVRDGKVMSARIE
jgi:hypothetical protein